MIFQIRPLDAAIATADFHCGSVPLNDYIRRYASQDVRKNVARVFVSTPEKNPQQLAGFFTLSAGSVSCSSLPATLARKLPRYPIPVALIGRLAVDNNFQGKGLGSILLADACQKVSLASAVLAVAGIIVDAKDDKAITFYEHFGFIPLQGQTDRMLLPASVFQKK
ncbi:MAG: GNAT family N-acetyltransferase [Gallionellaceae bacterium]|jgi:GNAT superfamily N-acetyltransferase